MSHPPAVPVLGFYRRFLEVCDRFGDNIAIEVQREHSLERVAYKDLKIQGESVGAWLLARGIRDGARCSILADNSARWVAAYLGVLASGNVAVPLDTAIKPDQTRKLLQDSGSELLFTDAKHLPAAQEAVRGTEIRLAGLDASAEALTTDLDAIFAAGVGGFRHIDRKPDETAVILYTSGTTSDPKGVMLTHGNLEFEAASVFRFIDFTFKDSILGVLPLFHALAQMANLLLPLACGARVVYLESLSTTELLRALREREITLFCCVPQFFYLIHERVREQLRAKPWITRQLFHILLRVNGGLRAIGFNAGKLFFRPVHALFGQRMHYLVTGGSRFDIEIATEFHRLGFLLLQAYGLTECSGGATVTPPHDHALGSVGPALPGVQVKIAPSEMSDDPAVGEVAVSGGNIMAGYYNRPDATAAVLRDGWLYTGDLGRLDARGNLYITGRQKEIIVLSSGKNIYPEEIEAHYLKTPVVKEICIVGLESAPGQPAAEHLHAVVVPNFDELRRRKVVNMENVIRFELESLSAQLASTKRIHSYEILREELPRTTTRKLKRFEILQDVRRRKIAGAQESVAVPPNEDEQLWLADAEVRRCLRIIAKASARALERLRPADNLELDLALDSMRRVELVVELEQELNVAIEESALAAVYTVGELVEVARHAQGTGKARAAGWSEVLAQDPEDPALLQAFQPRPVSTAIGYVVAKVLNALQRIFFRLEVSGLENLPAQGPYLIAPNHQSFFDPISLACVLPWTIFRQLFAVGTSEIFDGRLMRMLANALKTVPVDPDANLVMAMRAAAAGLRRGKILILYPEGERSIDGEPKQFRKGAAILASHLGVPIVPVAHEGYYQAWPRGQGFQGRSHFKLRFGAPIDPRPFAALPDGDQRLTDTLRKRVIALRSELQRP